MKNTKCQYMNFVHRSTPNVLLTWTYTWTKEVSKQNSYKLKSIDGNHDVLEDLA